MKKELYTIFGSTGFIGSNLDKFLREDNFNVITPKKGKFIFKKNLGHVIYCIGTSQATVDPLGSLNANLNILCKILFNNKFKSFTYLSSIRIYSSNNRTNENDIIKFNFNENDIFFKALKICAESICLQIKNPKIRILRLSNISGSGFSKQKYLLPTLINKYKNKKKINIFINKKSLKNYLSIMDLYKLILLIIKKGKKRIYNIANSKSLSIEELINNIKKVAYLDIKYHKNSKIKNEPKININLIKKEFKFKSKINIKDEIIKNFIKII
jgi:nucleoside-diphosphate-sugar epimerase